MADPSPSHALSHAFLGRRSSLLRRLARLVGCRSTAEDLVQDAWVRSAAAGPVAEAAPFLDRVAANLARAWVQAGFRVGVIKPVSTGGILRDGQLCSTDADALIVAISTTGSPFPPPPHNRVAPLIYPLPVAPVVAARAVGTPLSTTNVVDAVHKAIDWWTVEAGAELLIIEGVGGLLCPIAESGWTVADLAVHLGYPVLIVARRGLGTLLR